MTKVVNDSKDKASTLGQDIKTIMTIIHKVDNADSIRNNNDMKRDDNTMEMMEENATPISDAVKDLNDDLMALIAEESIKQMSFGKSEPTSSPSTGERYETSPHVTEGNKPFVSLKKMVSSERFDEIIGNYKKSIEKVHYRLDELERDELVTIVMHLRSDLFATDPSNLPSYAITDGDGETQKEENRDKILRYLLQQSNAHDKLLKEIIAGMQPPPPVIKPAQQRSSIADRVVHVVLGVMLSWTLITLIRNQ